MLSAPSVLSVDTALHSDMWCAGTVCCFDITDQMLFCMTEGC